MQCFLSLFFLFLFYHYASFSIITFGTVFIIHLRILIEKAMFFPSLLSLLVLSLFFIHPYYILNWFYHPSSYRFRIPNFFLPFPYLHVISSRLHPYLLLLYFPLPLTGVLKREVSRQLSLSFG